MITKVKNSVVLKPVAMLLAFSFLFLSYTTAGNVATIRAGLPIMVQLTQDLSSKDMAIGQSISARVTNDVKVDNIVVISAGSIAKGQVISITKPKGVGRAGSIGIMINSVQAVDGTQIQLSSTNISREGNDQKGLAWGLGIAGCLLTGIGFVVMFFIKGEDGKIPAGTTIDTNVASNVQVQIN